MLALLNPAVIGIVMLLVSVLWMLRDESDKSRQFLVIAVILNLFYGWLLNVLMGHANSLLPWKYDYYLYRVDDALGVSASSVALAFPGAWHTGLNVVYELLLPMMIVWLARHRERDRSGLIFAYIAEMLVGPALYMIVPAVGPASTFGASWLQPHSVNAETMRLSGMPNAFPSLHLATALVLVLFARNRTWRAISLAFLAGTALSTLTTGEHYVIDLVAGLSFGCFAAAVGRRKVAAASAYLAITVCWSLAIRLGGNTLALHTAALQFSVLLTLAISMRAVWSEWRAALPCELASSSIQGAGVGLSKEPAGLN